MNAQHRESSDPYIGRSADPKAYFSDVVSLYAAHRPGYPAAAVDRIVRDLPTRALIADIGCGTGIMSRELAARGFRVIGIDPNKQMLQGARQAAEDEMKLTYQLGSGEQTGLAAGSVDAVVCAQSFHWFDAAKALREFHRILVPRGRLALVWNVPDETDAFSARYREVMAAAQRHAESMGRVVEANCDTDPTLTGHFRDPIRDIVKHAVSHDREQLLGRVRSASYFPTRGPLRDELERRLMAEFAAYEVNGVVTLRYLAVLTLAVRAD